MVSGISWPDGDPFLQRQNEPTIAVSSRNSLHLLAGANDYRTVDLPGLPNGETGDAWLGIFKSYDGGATWRSTLHPGCAQNVPQCAGAPLLKEFAAGADPVVRPRASGMFFYSGIAFTRASPVHRRADRDAQSEYLHGTYYAGPDRHVALQFQGAGAHPAVVSGGGDELDAVDPNPMVHVPVDEKTKQRAAKALAGMGISVSDAVRMLLVRVAAEKALLFQLQFQNATTVKAMLAADGGIGKRSRSIDALFIDALFNELVAYPCRRFPNANLVAAIRDAAGLRRCDL